MNVNMLLPIDEYVRTPRQQGDIGVELEIEGAGLPEAVTGWAIKNEPSLRGHSFEYVTNGAMNLDTLRKRLRQLHLQLTTNGASVKLTPRASTHIHMNMQRESMRTFLGFIMYFQIIEPVLLRICGPERNGNLFCLPSTELWDGGWFGKSIVDITRINPFRQGIYHWPTRGSSGKSYSALNPDSLPRFGSIETRCWPNTIDPEKIFQWCSWLLMWREKMKHWPTQDFSDLFDKAYNNPHAFAFAAFPNENLFSICHPNNASELIQAGVETAYEFYVAVKPAFADLETSDPDVRPVRRRAKSPYVISDGWDPSPLSTFGEEPA